MLKRVGGRELSGKTEVFIKEASFPVPFQPGLEFNSPAHGNWNIVHTGMLVPEARQIYVCADNCMRGVVLTAAEMNAADRFSFVIVEEKDLLGGNLEDVTIEGVTDILDRLDAICSDDNAYRSFSGKQDDMDGNVKFVIETAAIESDDDK